MELRDKAEKSIIYTWDMPYFSVRNAFDMPETKLLLCEQMTA